MNVQVSKSFADVFSIDTENPTVISVTPIPSTITDADIGTGKFKLDIVFSEPMKTTVYPDLAFTPDLATLDTIENASYSWSSSTKCVVTYDVKDTGKNIVGIDVLVENAQDENMNIHVSSTNLDKFNIDTLEPTPTSITITLVDVDFNDIANIGDNIRVEVDMTGQPDTQTVTADLGAYGGSETESLTKINDNWRVDFTIVDGPNGIDVPAYHDNSKVTATATDDVGNTDTITSDSLDKPVDSLAPEPPTEVTATAIAGGKIRLDWISSASPDVVSYNIYRDNESPATTLVATGVTGTMWTEPDPLIDGETYYYRMKSVDDANNIGDYSNEDSATAVFPAAVDVSATYSASMSLSLSANEVAWPEPGVFSYWSSPEKALASDNQYAFITLALFEEEIPPEVTGMILYFENAPEELSGCDITSVKLKVEQKIISDFVFATDDYWLFILGAEMPELIGEPEDPWLYLEEELLPEELFIFSPGTETETILSYDITEIVDFCASEEFEGDWWLYTKYMSLCVFSMTEETPTGEWYIDHVWIEVNYVYEVGDHSITVPVGGQATITAYVTDMFGDPVPDETEVHFETDLGTVYPVSDLTVEGSASTTLSSTDVGTATVTATSDDAEGSCTVTFVVDTLLDIELSPGWNLISVPRELENSAIENVFYGITTVERVYTYQDGDWYAAFYDDDEWTYLGDYELTEIVDGMGYWVYASAPTTLTLTLKPLEYVATPPEYPLPTGWSLIGYTSLPLDPQMPVEVYLTSVEGIWKTLYRYDPAVDYELAKPSYGFTYVEIGRGYWIYLTADGVLVP